MKIFLLYIEVLILATFYRIIMCPLVFITEELALLNRTAETYSKLDCHFWQQSKVQARYAYVKEMALKKKVEKK